MKHIFIAGRKPEWPVLLLLHGTGGNERDLLPIAEMIAPEASVLGVRGNVSENGMPRFFRRLAEGVFDEEDLIHRTKELSDFLDDSAEQYGFDRKRIIAVGYSNGANIAASLFYHHEDALMGGILLHAMVPRRGVTLPDLSGKRIYIGAGKRDPIVDPDNTKELVRHLQSAGADVKEFWNEGGHQITREEIEHAKLWFTEHYAAD